MNITPIISQLETERDNIDQAITVLKAVNTPNNTINTGTPTKSLFYRPTQPAAPKPVTTINTGRRRGPRFMSAEARAKISKAAKARWRRVKREQKAALAA